jgi:hypothetical protein
MKHDQKILQDDEIDLREIIKTLWNEKILILSISFIFIVIGYVYGALQPKIYKTEITIRNVSSSLFEAYHPFFSTEQQQQQKGIAGEFNDNFKLNLSSLDTLVQFVENNNKINNFKNYLKEKDISARKYFTGKFEPVIDKKNNIQNKYSLTYSPPLLGESFLNDYIIFAHQQTVTIFKQQLMQVISNNINIHQQHLEIAKKIDLQNPILRSMQEEGQSVTNEPYAPFYRGTKVLTQQITYLNKLLNETKNLTLDYNPILEQASSPKLTTKSAINYPVIALLLGLFFSLLIVFIRSAKHR